MKIPSPFKISDFSAGLAPRRGGRVARDRRAARGIALVITLIMLAITLVMAVAFLALAQRERRSVSGSTDAATARLAADSAAQAAIGQITANLLPAPSGNAYNLHLLVSTNYINPNGFQTGIASPTNVNYAYGNGSFLNNADLIQNVQNLWFLPRPPVFVLTNETHPNYDFRFYLDLDENGMFDPNGAQPVISDDPNNPYYGQDGAPLPTYNPPNVLSNVFVGDPEWIGVLEHPDAPHSKNNHFIARYAFIAVPVGNALDVNYIHNQAFTKTVNINPSQTGVSDGYFRNQGVGSWELNLAAFLTDLNTNMWDNTTAPYYYGRVASFQNTGYAFDDARSLLSYRYGFSYNNLAAANQVLGNADNVFKYDRIDAYSDGSLQTTLNTNADANTLSNDGDLSPSDYWLGADNTNHFYTLGDFFDANKVSGSSSIVGFTNRLRNAGNYQLNGNHPTYDRYTLYRMLDQLGWDSSPEDGKLNLNYSNAVVQLDGSWVVTNIAVITGAETNLVPWQALDFFLAASDRLLRSNTTAWCNANYNSFTNSFAVTAPFGISSIPVWVSNRFVYQPSVNRLLQLAANLYDATTNGNYNLPHVFRPVFKSVNHGVFNDIFIIGYTSVTNVSDSSDRQFALPYDVTLLDVTLLNGASESPITDGNGLINVYGVPWIIGAKKGLPNFNQFSMLNAVQVTRKIEVQRTSTDPATAVFTTNQMYMIGISNMVGVEFWNSYSNAYDARSGADISVYVSDLVSQTLTNAVNRWVVTSNLTASYTMSSWPGSLWRGTAPNATPTNGSFLGFSWPILFQSPIAYNFNTAEFDPSGTWLTTAPPLPELPQFGLLITNHLRAIILDGHNVIDYVQLREPISIGGLNQALADPDYPDSTGTYYQWSTNYYSSSTTIPYGIANQVWVSGHPSDAPAGGQWATEPTPMGVATKDAEAAYFNGFFTTSFQYNQKPYSNVQPVQQAPYTPSRTVYSSYLLQANDPLVHYLASDLNCQAGAWAIWANSTKLQNGIWYHNDDVTTLPVPPISPIGGRYQPWLRKGQMDGLSALDVLPVTNNYACKDSLVWNSDNWDFPTNQYPTVGWIGRVHRGTPWQTVYLKDGDLTKQTNSLQIPVGTNTWANWTGDILRDYQTGQYFDAARTAPVQDRLLFDLFTTRLNDNAVRGTLPVNQTHLAAWSALFSGMVVLSNSAPFVFASTPLSYSNLIINPAGLDSQNSALYLIVTNINATRADTNLFPQQAFTHVGDVLASSALTKLSPFLNTGSKDTGKQQMNYGISDELYEWLPQQMMGLVRASEPRYVLYCYGQALRPADNGKVMSGDNALLITNYQVVAESALRAVIRVENANTSTPRPVVESSTVLPSY